MWHLNIQPGDRLRQLGAQLRILAADVPHRRFDVPGGLEQHLLVEQLDGRYVPGAGVVAVDRAARLGIRGDRKLKCGGTGLAALRAEQVAHGDVGAGIGDGNPFAATILIAGPVALWRRRRVFVDGIVGDYPVRGVA